MIQQKLTIGFVLDDRLDKPDGVQQYITLLGSWLAGHGHEVHYLVGESPSLKSRKDVHHLGRTVEVKFNKNKMGIPLPVKTRRISELYKQINFDILHVQMPYSPQVAARLIAKAPKTIAIVGTFHILPYSFLERSGTRVLAAALTRTRRKFDKIFSVSDAAKVFAEKYFKVSSDVMPNMVDVDVFKRPYAKSGSRKKIVFLGRLVERKGAVELILAFQSLLDKYPENVEGTELIIGGRGQLLGKLEQIKSEIEQKHPGAKITLSGFVDELDKPDFLNQAQIAAFPATGGESFGITLLEGMAANAGVVLAGDNPGYSSVLGSIPESLFDPRNIDDFAEKLQLILASSSLVKDMHAKQQKLITQFDVNFVGKKILAEYQKLALEKQKQHN